MHAGSRFCIPGTLPSWVADVRLSMSNHLDFGEMSMASNGADVCIWVCAHIATQCPPQSLNLQYDVCHESKNTLVVSSNCNETRNEVLLIKEKEAVSDVHILHLSKKLLRFLQCRTKSKVK